MTRDLAKRNAALAAARHAGASAEEIEALETALGEAQDAAREFVVTNEFGQIVEQAGNGRRERGQLVRRQLGRASHGSRS